MTAARKNELSVLQFLDVNSHEKKMDVLRALLQAGENESRVGFSDILKRLQSDDTEKPNKSLIYRLLSSLEADGFIKVDRSGYKHRYSSDLEQIKKTLQKKRERTLDELSEREVRLERQLERLRNMDIGLLVNRLIKAITDAKWTDRSRFGMGLRSLQLMADREAYAQAVKGDTIRITVDDVDLLSDRWNRRLEGFGHLASRGVRVRALFTEACKRVKDKWRDTKEEYVSFKSEGLDVDFRIRTEDLTYQIVARSTDVLVLTVAEEPLASICVPRNENPSLLDDVVDSFDAEFLSSVNLLECVA
ncbi:MAG: hypothetical protein ACOC38_06240 [Promethearchaeia archaeon]